jgi:ATPase family associated with various cellular activities (AAA)/Winged helix domain, variant
MSAPGWIETNQELLAAEFARLKCVLAGEDTSNAEAASAKVRAALNSPPAIDVLARAFELSDFEREVLLLCAGMEMDGALAVQCAELDVTRQARVTFGMALANLSSPHWSALAPVRPLRFWRLLELQDENAPASSRLRVDERILHFLAGVNYLDARLRALLTAHDGATVLCERQTEVVESVTAVIAPGTTAAPVIQLVGDDAAAQIEVARRAVERLSLRLHEIRPGEIPADAHEADALALLWSREAMLLGSALIIRMGDAASGPMVSRFLQRAGGIVFVAARDAVPLTRKDHRFTLNRPDAVEQKKLWLRVLGSDAERLNGSLDAVASQFRLDSDSIARAAHALRAAGAGEEVESALWRTCRESVRKRLDDLAQRVQPKARWKDLVLPELQLATLRQIAAHVRRRMQVYEDWGFAAKDERGLGISVLFSGESGTGKTMAAEVLANELSLDLYRIDLASMVSKYIGETEKNLRRVFDAAEDGGAILLFDEADALFGRRSTVRDSHDRYANIEVSYLLQRMEAYRGVAILTTNSKASLDPAFERRLRFSLHFPFPDQSQRERIWRGAFPPGVPLNGINPALLARLNVAGGSIRNIAINAAFLAAEDNTPVGIAHVSRAARLEATKRERPFSDAETRGWM